MIIGSVDVIDGAVVTHRDSYLLSHLTTVSVRRPYMASGMLFSCSLTGYGVAFIDLLYWHEVLTLIAISAALVWGGLKIGQLTLLSRDLRGSELASAIWGDHKRLQTIRREIVSALKNSGGHHAS
ncbi:hypothetical protein [Roseibium sp. MB-4]